MKTSVPGFIYVMQLGHLSYIKIGFSTDVDRRRRDFEQASPLEFLVLAAVPGIEDDERKIHKRLLPWSTRGEWYAPDAQFIRVLSEIIGLPIALQSADDFTMEVRRRLRARMATVLRQKRDLLQRHRALLSQQALPIPETLSLSRLRERYRQQHQLIADLRQYEREVIADKENRDADNDQLSKDIRDTMRLAEAAVAALEADELPEPCWAAYT